MSHCTVRARARARVVLPVPGTSSISRCPPAIMVITARSIAGRRQQSTCSRASAMRAIRSRAKCRSSSETTRAATRVPVAARRSATGWLPARSGWLDSDPRCIIFTPKGSGRRGGERPPGAGIVAQHISMMPLGARGYALRAFLNRLVNCAEDAPATSCVAHH